MEVTLMVEQRRHGISLGKPFSPGIMGRRFSPELFILISYPQIGYLPSAPWFLKQLRLHFMEHTLFRTNSSDGQFHAESER